MTKQLVAKTAKRLDVHPLVAIRYLVTGTTANAMFDLATMHRIAREWKAYRR